MKTSPLNIVIKICFCSFESKTTKIWLITEARTITTGSRSSSMNAVRLTAPIPLNPETSTTHTAAIACRWATISAARLISTLRWNVPVLKGKEADLHGCFLACSLSRISLIEPRVTVDDSLYRNYS